MSPSNARIKNAQRRIVQKAQYEQRDARNAAEVTGLPAELGLDQYFQGDSAEFGNDQSGLQNLTAQERVSDSVGDVATRRAVQGTDVSDPNSIIISEYKRRPGLLGYLQPKERVSTQITLGEPNQPLLACKRHSRPVISGFSKMMWSSAPLLMRNGP